VVNRILEFLQGKSINRLLVRRRRNACLNSKLVGVLFTSLGTLHSLDEFLLSRLCPVFIGWFAIYLSVQCVVGLHHSCWVGLERTCGIHTGIVCKTVSKLGARPRIFKLILRLLGFLLN
jgi:hypothetical protein